MSSIVAWRRSWLIRSLTQMPRAPRERAWRTFIKRTSPMRPRGPYFVWLPWRPRQARSVTAITLNKVSINLSLPMIWARKNFARSDSSVCTKIARSSEGSSPKRKRQWTWPDRSQSLRNAHSLQSCPGYLPDLIRRMCKTTSRLQEGAHLSSSMRSRSGSKRLRLGSWTTSSILRRPRNLSRLSASTES